MWSILPALELLPLKCSSRGVHSRRGASPMLAKWIKLDLPKTQPSFPMCEYSSEYEYDLRWRVIIAILLIQEACNMYVSRSKSLFVDTLLFTITSIFKWIRLCTFQCSLKCNWAVIELAVTLTHSIWIEWDWNYFWTKGAFDKTMKCVEDNDNNFELLFKYRGKDAFKKLYNRWKHGMFG